MEDQWTRRVWPPPGQEALTARREDAVQREEAAHRGDPTWPRDLVWRGGPAGLHDSAELANAAGPGGPVESGDAGRSEQPPSAHRYGTPVRPPRGTPRWLSRLLVALLALLSAGTVLGAVVLTVLNQAEAEPPRVVNDPLAGVYYELPPGWREGVVAPVTGFTSVAAHGDLVTFMARPEERVDPPNLRSVVIELSDLYARLLLHGDETEVVDDRAVTINGRPGHTRAVRAAYRDVVNEPAFMRVTLLTRSDGRSTVLLALAHPDSPRSRAEVESLISGVR